MPVDRIVDEQERPKKLFFSAEKQQKFVRYLRVHFRGRMYRNLHSFSCFAQIVARNRAIKLVFRKAAT
jgi:hypothetical protein